MKKATFVTFLVCVSFLVVSCTNANWSMSGSNSNRLFSSKIPQNTNISKIWDFSLRSLTLTNPILDDDYLYCVISDSDINGLVFIEKSNGAVIGAPIILPDNYTYSLALDKNNIYVATGERVLAYSKATRLMIWEEQFEGEEVFSLIPDNNLLFGVSSGGQIFAIHIDTGVYKWNWKINKDYIYRWISKNDQIIIVSGNKKGTDEIIYTAVDALYGNYLWTIHEHGSPDFPAQIDDNKFYIATSRSVKCCEINTAATIWSIQLMVDDKNDETLQLETALSIIDDSMFFVLDGSIIEMSLKKASIESKIIVPGTSKVKILFATPNALYIALDGNPFLLVYNRNTKKFSTRVTGKRLVLGAAISEGIYIQSQESIALYK